MIYTDQFQTTPASYQGSATLSFQHHLRKTRQSDLSCLSDTFFEMIRIKTGITTIRKQSGFYSRTENMLNAEKQKTRRKCQFQPTPKQNMFHLLIAQRRIVDQ